jgi:UDP-N-acetylmuramate--alanine ligase
MNIYCSAIGGIGLSAYAALMHHNGHTVKGSDRSDSALLDDLRSQGIAVTLNQDGTEVPDDIDLFVHSAAIPEDHPERIKAKELGVKSLTYFEALGGFTKGYKLITVSGTHGKSSTTAMVADVLIAAGYDPTVVVGTKLGSLGGRNWRQGQSEWCVVEACEYKGSFFNLHPSIAIILNCDWDHVDAYPTPQSFHDAFITFLNNVPSDGMVISHGGDPECQMVVKAAGHTLIDADTQPLLTDMHVPGIHMQQNAQTALELAAKLGIDHDVAAKALREHKGIWRRMEEKGSYSDDVLVIDDYGHHPLEIKLTLEALKKRHSGRRLVCVFQPHMHNRTLELYDDFLTSFTMCDVVLVPYVYDARHAVERDEVDVQKFVDDIAEKSNVECRWTKTLEDTETLLKDNILQPGDLLVCMGAGDVTDLAERMVI